MPNQYLPQIFQAIVAHMAEGVIFLDTQDLIRVCNPAAERIRKVKAERIIGQHILSLHPPNTHQRVRELLHSLKSGVFSASNRVIRVGSHYFDNSYSAIRDPQGEYLGTLLVSRDITEQRRLSEENLNLKNPRPVDGAPPLVAQSEKMKRVVEMAEAVAVLDSTVLVTGENGTGKEHVVDIIHRNSHRREGPLVRVNCAAMPETLIESELFGHLKGAFTGAAEDRKGKFELADGGTIFLDEIGEIPYNAQAKLLRAIQEKAVQPVGGKREVRVDVRIIAATNRDLAREVAEGKFREDLYYRLNVITIDLPPLRQRREDIIPLAELFIARFAREMRRPVRSLSPAVRDLLLNHPFPGNVRQLKHAMERAVALGKGELILPDDLPAELNCRKSYPCNSAISPGQPLKDALAWFEKEYIAQALQIHRRKKLETAEALGISRKSLWEKVQRYELDGLDVTEQ